MAKLSGVKQLQMALALEVVLNGIHPNDHSVRAAPISISFLPLRASYVQTSRPSPVNQIIYGVLTCCNSPSARSPSIPPQHICNPHVPTSKTRPTRPTLKTLPSNKCVHRHSQITQSQTRTPPRNVCIAPHPRLRSANQPSLAPPARAPESHVQHPHPHTNPMFPSTVRLLTSDP